MVMWYNGDGLMVKTSNTGTATDIMVGVGGGGSVRRPARKSSSHI